MKSLDAPDASGRGADTALGKVSPPLSGRLGQLLVAEGLITEEQLARALGELKTSGERLGAVLVRLGLLNEVRLAQFLARVHRVAVVPLDQPIDEEVLALVPQSIARKYDVIPIERVR